MITTNLLSFILAVLLLLGLPLSPGLSFPPSPADAASPVAVAVDHYLTSLPADVHAIGSVDALKRQLTSGTTLLIDVRGPSEFRAGHIADAINIPLRNLDRHLEEFPPDQEMVLYCSSGYRSAMGVMALQLQGLDHVRGFPPGFAGWKAAGEAVIRP